MCWVNSKKWYTAVGRMIEQPNPLDPGGCSIILPNGCKFALSQHSSENMAFGDRRPSYPHKFRHCKNMNAPKPPPPPSFAAVLLAGGRSRRMGRDKALLPVPGGGLLWQRQIGILRSLGPAELFISGPARPGFPEDACLLADDRPGCGPLAGIAAALGAMRAPLLVVLAVDLPAMEADYLRGLLARCAPGMGSVPHGEFYEPLAAVYPRECLETARERLRGGSLALQGFVRAAGSLLRPRPIAPGEKMLFVNWNEPGDHPRAPPTD